MTDRQNTPQRKRFKGILRFFGKAENVLSGRLLNAADAATDRRICGRSLVEYVPSIFRDDRNGIGGTGSQSTHYIILKRIFRHVELKPSDALIDVGCGKGRILAFLLKNKCPSRLFGVEHNEEVAGIAAGWAKRYEQVTILCDDAFRLDYNDYTVLVLARPFLPKTFLQFVERLEGMLDYPITLVYWVDQQSGFLLNKRPGWTLEFREKLTRIHGIRIAHWEQGYSIWTYDPAGRAESGA